MFESEASDLVGNDQNGVADVFLRDLAAQKPILISANTNKLRSGLGASGGATMTPDAQFVVFDSIAPDLVMNDGDDREDIFIWERKTGATTLISVEAERPGTGAENYTTPSLTSDGRFVLFLGRATNDWRRSEVYLRDRSSDTTHWVSSNVWSFRESFPMVLTSAIVVLSSNRYQTNLVIQTNALCVNPALSDNGRYIAFKTVSSQDRAMVLYHDVQSGISTLVSTNAVGNLLDFSDLSGPAMTPDGRSLAFVSRATNKTPAIVQIWDAATGQLDLASPTVAGGISVTGDADTPLLSGD
ncbi:MAG: PD40 domain-containing protein, partial [Pedosphaera parvula]|nr:PD40 domain-containing protein [Pedosphaera parvula]